MIYSMRENEDACLYTLPQIHPVYQYPHLDSALTFDPTQPYTQQIPCTLTFLTQTLEWRKRVLSAWKQRLVSSTRSWQPRRRKGLMVWHTWQAPTSGPRTLQGKWQPCKPRQLLPQGRWGVPSNDI